MKSFLKIFFASFVALTIFSLLAIVIGFWILTSVLQPDKPQVGSKGVLVLDLNVAYNEQEKDNPLSALSGNESGNAPGLYDVVRMLHYAKTDSTIKGLYIKGGYNANGFASSEELRKAVVDFKESKKFVIAYGETLDQKSYYVSTAADKVYCHPQGGIDWDGFSVTLLFMKGLLDKLGVEPQVFYAGKFKSATEPFRFTKMSDPNRLQTTDMLNDLYATFLETTAQARKIDTATLHQLSIDGTIRTASDALANKLVDGLKYDDEVKDELIKKLNIKEADKINFVSLGKYAKAVNFKNSKGDDKIAIIYASGDIVGGKGQDGEIGSDNFVELIRKARLDDDVKAIVFRVNSPGGSSLASDAIWREITLAKKEKPVVVSMGDYAASGGYYISCNADSVFADASTITGSIGVFSLLPNMQKLFNDKLGITFDGVKTAPYADMGGINRPLTEPEKRFLQLSIDSIYSTFKQRVADGRKTDINFIDSIAQGHVYTGQRAISLRLVDRTGTLQDAVNCAARMAKSKSYWLKEYPEKKSFWEELTNVSSYTESASEKTIENKIGKDQYNMLQQVNKIKEMIKTPQSRLPFDLTVN
ncbi:signal peptide peptidase SppA [Panacibacter ginsenosidivorans]|uniref:Signal peptide peptidase SppA n=1 Tax=Panacibacter ginsenosidivorans TaxID=1813871 RepID=A0A5B8V4U5_9BACT|nr:signal peptide peptidase SppA [Panacibacter ginsenosidivorans]QEC66414.1 signal peptide peptidase SppA [Panacibacter ginsenosidivorans]